MTATDTDAVFTTEVMGRCGTQGSVELEILTDPPGVYAGKYVRLTVTQLSPTGDSRAEVLIHYAEAMDLGVLLASLARDAGIEADRESEARAQRAAERGA